MATRSAALDPAAAQIVAMLPPEDPDAVIDLEAARAGYDMLGGFGGGDDIPADALDISDTVLAGVPVRIYRPLGGESNRGTLVFFHGGGFTIGSLTSHHAQCRQLAALSGATVIAVDYRLSPEHLFPAPLDDAEAVVGWVLDHGAEIGVDANRVGVCGNSAGGGISAAVAQRFGPRLLFQGLLYPTVDFAGEWPSDVENGTGYLLTAKTMKWFRSQTAPDEAMWKDPRLSPLYGDLTGVAPAWVLVCGYDPLRDSGEAYAIALDKAGVPTTFVHASDQIHECVQLAGAIPAGRALLEQLAQAAREALAK